MNKEELKDDDKVSTGENVLAVVQTKLAPKCKDPEILTIPCTTVKKRMKQHILDVKNPYIPCFTPVLLGKLVMKRPSGMPIVCSIIEIDPGPERICNLKGDGRMKVKVALDRYLESPHQQIRSLHFNRTDDETRVPPLGPPPWRGKSELVPFRNYTKRQVGADYCKLFFKSGQEYYHIPFMEWIMKKVFKRDTQ